MPKIKAFIRSSFLAIAILALSGLAPVATIARVSAEESADTAATNSTATEEEPADTPDGTKEADDKSSEKPSDTKEATKPKQGASNTGPQKPNGAAANTYNYNEATGLWENEHYTWDPVTKQTKPKKPQSYSYNPATGMWDTEEWRYNPATGKYEPNVVSTPELPSTASASPQAKALAAQNGSSSINNQGPNATGQINSTSNNSAAYDLFYNAAISNRIDSSASSGDASVLNNTKAGDALTGDATVIANILNMLQSYWGLSGGGLLTFFADIVGNVVGDLMIDPAQITGNGPGSNNSINSSQNSDIDLNVEQNGRIDNDIDLSASSGDALVESNSEAGDAKSGNANAVANVINMLNSAISAGSSFMGILNIYGNLDGDILLPEGLLDGLIAGNGPNSSSTITANNQTDIDADFNSTNDINNNVNTNATTGQATVDGNTSAGNATSGNALTNLNILNLTGREIIGSNSLLVFVNVLGQWTGLIMDAPDGTTAAALGGNITGNGPGSTNSINSNTDTDVDIDVTTNNQINNDINVTAASGDATVRQNTSGGDATTGDATASANILNVTDSQFALSDFFGILFINVLGSWNGSFGINTEAGSLPNQPASSGSGTPSGRVFGFNGTVTTPGTPGPSTRLHSSAPAVALSTPQTNGDDNAGITLVSSDALPPENGSAISSQEPAVAASSTSSWMLPGFGLLIASSLLGIERFLTLHERRKLA